MIDCQRAKVLGTVMPKQKQEGQLGETRELLPGVKLARTLEEHEDIVTSLAFDPTGQVLASGSKDGTLILWDVVSGRPLRTLEGHSGRCFKDCLKASWHAVT